MNHLKKLAPVCFVSLIALIINGCCITKPNCDPEGGNFTWGPELSYRISKYTGSAAKDEDTKSIGAIGFGGYIHWIFCEDYPQMGFYSGLFYNQFGGKWDYGTSNETDKDRMHYLSIPFTFTYEVYDGLRVEAGPDISFLLAAKWIYEYNGVKETYDFKDDAATAQLGYNLALSYTHEQSGFGGFIRWNGAFTDPFSKEYVDDTDFKVHNGGISFGIRYGLNRLLYK
jgi:hypothetical protein